MEPSILRIALLGEMSLQLGETSLPPLESGRAESLLAYLVLHRAAPQPRQRLAFLLWPDSTEAQARTNLRHLLHTLRRVLPDADRYLEVTARTLRWRPDAPVWLDVAAFEDALARGALQEAVDIYSGELLQGSYDDWVLDERARLRDLLIDALERLCAALHGSGEDADAIACAERLVRVDPLREASYRLLMRLHDARGDRARALRAYHACTAALERDLGVGPSDATRAAYEALLPGASAAGPASEAAVPRFIGRAMERRRLTELWREAARGGARLVLIAGEAGVGKSRLVDELASWCAHRGVAVAEARSYPAEGALAFGPVVEWLRSEALALRRVRLDRGRLNELARVLPELPGTPQPMPADEQRLRLFDAMARAILASSAPVLLIADDLQWADRETLHFLHYLLRTRPDARLLVAATMRDEDVEPDQPLNDLVDGLRALGRIDQIDLQPLSRRETAVLAEGLAGRPLHLDESDRLFVETEGNPLFVVETVRAGALSPRVQAVIEARLAQLSEPARELARVAAAVGREFTTDVLATACGLGDDALMHGLDELWRRRLVRERGPDAYDFAHERIREVAYAGLEPARRRRTHIRVGRALAGAGDPAEVAFHFDRGGALDEAVSWYQRAAERAARRLADAEAVRVLRRALELARTPERRLELTTALVAPLAMLEGLSADALVSAQRHGLTLARELGVEPEPPLLRSLALTRLAAGDFDGARRFGEQLRARAERDRDDVQLAESHYALGVAAFWSVSLPEARRHFAAAIAGYRSEHRGVHLLRYGLDPQVVCMSRLANTLWFLDEVDAAIEARESAVALAEEIEHPATLGTALVFAGLLALDAGDEPGVRRYAAALEDLCRRHESRVIAIATDALAGYVQVLDADHASGLARIRRAVEQSSGTGNPAPGSHASQVRILIEACVVARDVRGGLAACEIPVHTRLWEARTQQLRARLVAMERSWNAPAANVPSHDR